MAFEQAFKTFMGTLRDIKAKLLLPSEQVIADQNLSWAVTQFGSECERLDTLFALAQSDAKAAADAAVVLALAEAVKAGTYIPKDAHESAITAAKQTATTEAETKFKTIAEAKAFADGKRVELATLITAEAAALVSDADLSAETHTATFATFTARAEKLKASGITVESLPSAFKIVASQKEDAAYEACIAAVVDAFKPGKLTVTASKEKVAVQGNGDAAKTELPAFATF